MRMRFFRQFDTVSTLTTVTDDQNVIDTKLTQRNDYWEGSWFYNTTLDKVSRIASSVESTGALVLETAITGMQATDEYQIYDLMSPIELNRHINEALVDHSWPHFYGVYESKNAIIMVEDLRVYDLSSISPSIWWIYNMWVERASKNYRGFVVASAAGTVTLPDDISFDDPDMGTTWAISIYDGTGKGQTVRYYASHSGQVMTLDANWETEPDTTSKFAFWNTEDQRMDFSPMKFVRLSSPEYPQFLSLEQVRDDLLGMRIKFQYAGLATKLSNETDTSIIPKGFIVPQALSIIYTKMIGSAKADRSRYSSLSQEYIRLTQEYIEAKSFKAPSSTVWNAVKYNGPDQIIASDYPF